MIEKARGFIAMPRSIFSDPNFAAEPYTEREAFLDLVAAAAWKPRRLKLRRGAVDLLRGQLLMSSRYAAERWQWSEPKARRFLDRISARRASDAQGDASGDAQADALIDAQVTPHGTIITIRSYDDFQKPQGANDVQSDAQNDAQSDAPNDAPLDVKTTQREEEIKNNTLLKESGARATRIPVDFELDDETRGWALDRLGNVDAVASSLRRFRDHYQQVAGNQGLSRDWQAKARLWVDDDARRARPTLAAESKQIVLDDEAWEQIISRFKRTGQWTRHVDVCGSEPMSAGCKVPAHILRKHGYASGAAA